MTPLETRSLKLVPQTREDALAFIANLKPHERAEVSPVWLAAVERSNSIDPWLHGFVMVSRDDSSVVGKCGFKGPPANGVVEIAYGVDVEHQGKGYATEVAAGLTDFAFTHASVRLVCAHTLPEPNASTHVLTKCGFRRVGEVIDPEDGPVWRWEKERTP